MKTKMVGWGILTLSLLFIGAFNWFYLPTPAQIRPVDRPIQVARTEAPLRFLFVGTSLTSSYSWPNQLDLCPDRLVSVYRTARAGAASDWGLAQAQVIVAQQPDVVFLEFSINDADWRHRISLQDSAENHRRLISRLQEDLPGVQILLMTMSPASGGRRILRPRLPAYYALYHELAAEMGVSLLDIYPRWLSIPRDSREQQDGLHPSDTAASRIIVPALGSILGMSC